MVVYRAHVFSGWRMLADHCRGHRTHYANHDALQRDDGYHAGGRINGDRSLCIKPSYAKDAWSNRYANESAAICYCRSGWIPTVSGNSEHTILYCQRDDAMCSAGGNFKAQYE